MKNDALGLVLAGLFASLLVFTLAVSTDATDSRIEYKALPPAMVLTFSNLPPAWQVQTSKDLTNWYSVILSGDVPPLTLDFVLTNAGQAQFYRVVSR